MAQAFLGTKIAECRPERPTSSPILKVVNRAHTNPDQPPGDPPVALLTSAVQSTTDGVPSSTSSPQGFQSSPGQPTGCDVKRSGFQTVISCFNPHPANRPGATGRACAYCRCCDGFQSSPGQPTGCDRPHGVVLGPHQSVSILTRPTDRVRRVRAQLHHARIRRFNPHPANRPGATSEDGRVARRSGVSILTRPTDRVRRRRPFRDLPVKAGFNPHPANRPGATSMCPEDAGRLRSFNPHPANRPGATPFRPIGL